MRHFFFFTLPLIIFLVYQAKSQDLMLSQTSAYVGDTIALTVSSPSTAFSTDSATSCPDKLQVSVSNVGLKQASATLYNPFAISTDTGALTADFALDIPTGTYQFIAGNGGNCPKYSSNFNLLQRRITASRNSAALGESFSLYLTGKGVNFSTSTTNCLSEIQISPSGLYLSNGTDTIQADSIKILASNQSRVWFSIPVTTLKGANYELVVGENCSNPYKIPFSVLGPTFSISPSLAAPSEKLTMTFSSPNLTFNDSGVVNCPTKLSVGVSDIVFKAASSTMEFSPTSISVDTGIVTAEVTIPAQATGDYQVFIGPDSGCQAVSSNVLSIVQRRITASKSSATIGESFNLDLTGTEINFSTSTTDCLSEIQISPSGLYLSNGIDTIQADSVEILASSQARVWISIPGTVLEGNNYELIVGENCPSTYEIPFTITGPAFSISPGQAVPSEKLTMTFSSPNLTFNDSGVVNCPTKLSVGVSDIVFKAASSTMEFSPTSISVDTGIVTAEVTIPAQATGDYQVFIGPDSGCQAVSSNTLSIETIPVWLSTNKTAYTGDTVNITLSSGSIGFEDSVASNCPSSLLTTQANTFLLISQDTIYPIALTTSGGNLTATLKIPDNAPVGTYPVIAGYGESCVVSQTLRIYPVKRSITFNSGLEYYYGDTVNFILSGINVYFSDSVQNCPVVYQAVPENFTFTDGNGTTYKPDTIWLANGKVYGNFFINDSIPDSTSFSITLGKDTCQTYTTHAFSVTKSVQKVYFSSNEYYYPGNTVHFSLTWSHLTFNDSVSSCPNQFKLDTSTFSFVNGSSHFTPDSVWFVGQNQIAGLWTIPYNTLPVDTYYNFMVGDSSTCFVTDTQVIFLRKFIPSVNLSSNFLYIGQTSNLRFSSNISFNDSLSNCPKTLKVTASNIVFSKDTVAFSPDSVSLPSYNMSVTVPANVPEGIYTLTFGKGEACSINQTIELRNIPPIFINPDMITPWMETNITIYPLTGNSDTLCGQIPDTNNLYLTYAQDTTYPVSVIISGDTAFATFPALNGTGGDTFWLNIDSCKLKSLTSSFLAGNSKPLSTEESLNIFPNPSEGQSLNLDVKLNGTVQVLIYNSLGNEIFSLEQNVPALIDLSTQASRLEPGLYAVKIVKDGKIYSKKFVIK